MFDLNGKVALVTGASRGVGRGIALELASSGARVYATGRSIAAAGLGDSIVSVVCDHANDAAIAKVFERIDADGGRLDILVNSAWGGYERMVEDGRFTWPVPFWEQPLHRWDSMIGIGVKAALVASQQAVRRMLPARQGLIVHLSSWAGQKYVGNLLYSLAKAATDRMAADMAHELRTHGIKVVSLYPGLVRTEAVVSAKVFDLSNSESPEFVGRAIAALATDPNADRWNGKVVVAAALARELGFTDIDGKSPRPLSLDEF